MKDKIAWLEPREWRVILAAVDFMVESMERQIKKEPLHVGNETLRFTIQRLDQCRTKLVNVLGDISASNDIPEEKPSEPTEKH